MTADITCPGNYTGVQAPPLQGMVKKILALSIAAIAAST
jgi:hypothetical protein